MSWTLGVDTSRKGIALELFSADGSQIFLHESALARGEMLANELDLFLNVRS